MIFEKMQQIFREIFADENLIITRETSPDNIPEWDSLTQVLLVEEVEKTFDLKIDLDDVFKIKTFGDFVQVIENYLNK